MVCITVNVMLYTLLNAYQSPIIYELFVALYYCFKVFSTEGLQQHVLQPVTLGLPNLHYEQGLRPKILGH